MIPAIVIGRAGSKGFPNKNETKVLGKELLRYPIEAALGTLFNVYFSTDSIKLAAIAEKAGAKIIQRPPELATDEALADDVFLHAYNYIKKETKEKIDCVVLLFANAPCVKWYMIQSMINQFDDCRMLGEPVDSICTVSKYNMYSINRARLEHKGFLINAVNNITTTCDRNSNGDFYFYDCSCAVVSAKVLENVKTMPPPQPWLGRSIKPYYQEVPAIDLDFEWQLGQIEYWLKQNKDK